MTKNRILQVLPSFDQGGVERCVLDISVGMASSTDQFIASCGGRLEQLLPPTVKHITLPLQSKNPLQMLKNSFAIERVIRDFNINLVHAHSRAPAWSAYLACHLLKIPFVTTYHATYNAQNSFKRSYNRIMAKGDKVIAISKHIARHIEQEHPRFKDRVILIPEGIDTNHFNPSKINQEKVRNLRQRWQVPLDHKLILLPGRLTKWKGQMDLLQAVDLIDHSQINLVFIGSAQGRTEYKKELLSFSKEKEIQLTLVENCQDMLHAFATADIIVSASNEPEAFGRVVAEGMSLGKTVIGMNHGATPEMIDDDLNGFLSNPSNPQELAEKILVALKSPPLPARDKISSLFSLETMIEKTKNLYNELCTG